MRNRIKNFRTRPSTTVSHIDVDVIEEGDEETESDVKVGLHVDIQRSDGRVHGAVISDIKRDKGVVTVEWFEEGETKGKEIELNLLLKINPTLMRTGKPQLSQIPEDLSDSDHVEEDESEQGVDKPDEDNRNEIQKKYDKMNKEFDSFDDFTHQVPALPYRVLATNSLFFQMMKNHPNARPLAEREEKERLREERQRQRVIEEKENRLEKGRNENGEEVEKVVVRPTTPEMQQLHIPDLRTCLRRMSEMPRRPEATPLRRRIRDSGALPRLTLATNNILEGLMRPHEMGTPGRRDSVVVPQRRMTVAPSHAAVLIEEDKEEMETISSRDPSLASARTVPSRRETDVHVMSSRQSARTQPTDGGGRRITRSGRKDGGSLVEKEEIPVMLFSDSEEEPEEELVGIEEAHSARVEALSARRSMMNSDAVEPVLHSTPVRVASQEPRRSGRLSRLMGVSPIRRRDSTVTTNYDDEEEGENTVGRSKRESAGADSLVITRMEEKDDKMSVESVDEEEDDLAEAIERSMILDDKRATALAGANDTVATLQATLMGDTVVGSGTLMFENTMGGAYGDGTRATLTEEYAGDTLMMGDNASVLPYAAPAARGSLQPQPRRRTTMGNEILDVSMASVASVATQRNCSMMSRRNVSQITNESRFADELPFYLRDFVGETALEQLLHVVGQEKVQEWRQQLPKDTLKNLKKLGEGTYGEVFSTMMNGAPVAMKIIPFEDEIQYFDGVVNGETLKSTAEILPEILITRELSSLDNERAAFSTSTFIPLVQCHVVKGNYPEELLKEWDAYNKKKKSENDRPSKYASPDALFVAIGLAMGGVDVETYKVKNEKEALSALFQLALALVVAENELEFEHRDLHIGNALIAQVPVKEEIKYRLLGRDVYVKSHGVKLSIIDFTNSRLRKDGTTIFLDLEQDEELFQGQGDYQFDIYRLMRQHNKGNWREFCPKSNIYWLHYMAKELILEERKKGLAKGFTKRRRKELFTVFDSLPEHDEIKAFLNSEAVYDIMQEFVRFEEAE